MTKAAIENALDHISATDGNGSLVKAGHVRNIQIFGDEVLIDVLCLNPTLQAKKKLEVDIMTAIHDRVNEKAKIGESA